MQLNNSNNIFVNMINTEDKIVIQELMIKYNLAIDNKNLDEWTNTWTDDGLQHLEKQKVKQN